MSFAALSIADMTILSIPPDNPDKIRHDWTTAEAREIIAAPLNDLVHAAQTFHRNHFDANEVQVSTLLSIKTGGARKTALIVRKAPTTKPMSAPTSSCRWTPSAPPPYGRRFRRNPVLQGAAWRDRRTATSTPFAT